VQQRRQHQQQYECLSRQIIGAPRYLNYCWREVIAMSALWTARQDDMARGLACKTLHCTTACLTTTSIIATEY
jgi:hypothetical protein